MILINIITSFQIPSQKDHFVLQISTVVVYVTAAQFSRQFLKKIRVIDILISSKNNDSELKNLLRAPIKTL